jgi:hypothetical protein
MPVKPKSLRDFLRPIGKIIVIDVETGEYEIDDVSLEAARRLKAKYPEATLYAMRIGYEAVYGFGGAPKRVKQ